ncbi:MAG TPA: arylsulfatase [Verrucomicrobiales bacterium]|nr:arylsulfatase [Verrucomicrobiales bacterium]
MKSMVPICSLLMITLLAVFVPSNSCAEKPNLVLIFCDDLGYGDLGCYGSTRNRTPAVDSIAAQGIRFTQFYSSSPVCTPSRSSLMTGCYAQRVGMHQDFTGHWVLIPRSRRGLHPDETTFAEALKQRGYATACIGKWHLGDQLEHLPTRHGFDRYFGIPYSNDMQSKRRGDPPLPILDHEKVIEAPADQATLTQRYTDQVVRFIEENRNQPFFVYLPHTFPHLPLFATPPFLEKSRNGKYGATIEEIDASTARILKTLDRLDLSENTLVIFTSDNGANLANGSSNGALAGRKGQTLEGGMRVPIVARWPGKIPRESVCHELATTMDLLPTFLSWVDGKSWQPSAEIDGKDIRNLFLNVEGAKTPHEVFFYYRRAQLQAVRSGSWKYHLPLDQTFPAWDNRERVGKGRPGKLINLDTDLQETTDLSSKYPDVVARLNGFAERARRTLGDADRIGVEQRPVLDVENPTPRIL